MKVIVQRVKKARLVSCDTVFCDMKQGILAYVCVERGDTAEIVQRQVRRICNCRIFDGEDGSRWALSLSETNYELLMVSNFSISANLKNGRKCDFHRSAPQEEARKLYEFALEYAGQLIGAERVHKGNFRNYMEIESVADGPLNIVID